jgi:hypothetical protein
MVIAMASFLFVGCLGEGVVTPPVDEDVDEDVDEVVTTTVAPVILTIAGISLTGTSEYINATEAAVVIVTGTAPTYSEVKVYVDAVCAGTANVGDTGLFEVVVAEADLGVDGAKVIYATAKEAALPVSPKSVEYAFILDQVAPGYSIAATAAGAEVTDSAVATMTVGGGTIPVAITAVTDADLVAGTWYIKVFGDSGDASNVTLTDPDAVVTTYTIGVDTSFVDTIPGVTFTITANNLLAGQVVKVKVTEAVASIDARATITFDEDVSTAGMIAGTYTTAGSDPTTYKEATDTGYWLVDLGSKDDIKVFSAYGFKDLAGNIAGTSASPITDVFTVGAASLYALAP